MASTLILDKAFTSPPPREVLLEVARAKNSTPLSFIKPHSGLRLPPDRHCLLSANYKLRAASVANPTKKLMKSAIEPRSTIKTQFKPPANTAATTTNKQPNLSQSQAPNLSVVTIPRPVIKTIVGQSKPTIITKPENKPGELKMEIDPLESSMSNISMKRKRSEDDTEMI